jgi:hypothetical protein
MPLDNSLNEDIHQCVQHHCALTNDFVDDHEQMFSMMTPNGGTSAYLRLWDTDLGGSCPSSKQIVEDVEKCFRSMAIYHDNKGCYSPELGKNRCHGHQEKTTSGLKKGEERE